MISSPASASVVATATNAILHPAVIAISSSVTSVSAPYLIFISSAMAVLSPGSPALGRYPQLEGADEARARASRTIWGGGTPGTPWDMSSRGRPSVGRYAAAHAYACGILRCPRLSKVRRDMRQVHSRRTACVLDRIRDTECEPTRAGGCNGHVVCCISLAPRQERVWRRSSTKWEKTKRRP